MPAHDGEAKSMRVKFNIEGPRKRHAYVYASVTPGMQKGEWLYLIVQITATGEVFTIHDTRDQEHAEQKSLLDQLRSTFTGPAAEATE